PPALAKMHPLSLHDALPIFDTSALVKLYVDETGAPLVRQGVQGADAVATSEIAYVEIRAALARRRRDGALRAGDHRRLLRRLHTDRKSTRLNSSHVKISYAV